jgi:hypothetical protein
MLATDWFMVTFRLLHIVAGVFWVGSVFMLVVFLQPTAASVGPAGAPFMGELLGKRRLVDRIIWLGTITVLAGLVMYWKDWHDMASFSAWFDTAFGKALTVGGLCAIVALGFGIFVTRPGIQRVIALGQRAAQSDGPPPPEIAAEVGAIQQRLKIYARIGFALLVAAVLLMATGRYL